MLDFVIFTRPCDGKAFAVRASSVSVVTIDQKDPSRTILHFSSGDDGFICKEDFRKVLKKLRGLHVQEGEQ